MQITSFEVNKLLTSQFEKQSDMRKVLIGISMYLLVIIFLVCLLKTGCYADYQIISITEYKSKSIKEPTTGYQKWVILEFDNRSKKVCVSNVYKSKKSYDYIRLYDSGFYEIYLR